MQLQTIEGRKEGKNGGREGRGGGGEEKGGMERGRRKEKKKLTY